MTEEEKDNSGIWRKFLKRHWGMAVLFILGAVLAAIGAVLVFLWFAGQAQATGIVPTTLATLTMGELVLFILNLVFWELVLIGIPIVVALIAFYAGYRRLPAEEREEYRRGGLWGNKSRRRDFSGAFTFFVNIVFVIKIYTDGNWNLPFSNWTVDYVVNSYVLAIVVVAIIVAVPILIGGTWWLRREIRS
ncbi:MAG: hypothetical protein LUO79_05170 [Methanomassiliicoccales archaeon]|nr:hypothetical protein [Methanomassiliicoccales archaeon]